MDMILARGGPPAPPYHPEIRYRELKMDPYKRVCSLGGKRLSLTPTEFSILQALLESLGTPVSLRELAERVWDDAVYISRGDSIAVHIRHLRQKLNDTAKPFRYVKTVWGVGYRIG